MKIALECPSSLLDDIQPLADFDFALTHLVLSDEKYAEWYKNSKRFKILDNSTNELLEPCSLEDIKKAADIIQPNLIVPPDHLGNHFATIESLDKAIKLFWIEKILPVVQGHELRYVLGCFDYIQNLGFKRVAVPYDILSSRQDNVTVMAENRQKVVNSIIAKMSIGSEIHLLGFNTLEELWDCNRGWVTSIDTGSPILHGLCGKRYSKDSLIPKNTPTYNLMEKCDLNLGKSDIFYNIAMLRKVCNYA